MENKKDYEQMYYDSQYEIKKLKKKIKYLEDTIYEMNLSRNKNNINLQAYIIKEISRYKEEKEKKDEQNELHDTGVRRDIYKKYGENTLSTSSGRKDC